MERIEYNINIETYEGPMDLLIDLIKKNEIDIYDIPIHIITEQFVEYIREANKVNLELTSDFILMASTLIEIKSKMLLPKLKVEDDEIEEDIDPRDDLVQKIIEYEKYREVSKQLKESASYESKAYYKLQEDFVSIEDLDLLKNCDIDSLSKAFTNLILKKNKKEYVEKIRTDSFPVERATFLVIEKLKIEKEFLFSDLLDVGSDINEIVSYFLSILELVKIGSIFANQYNEYQDIKIERRKEFSFE